MSSDSHSRQRSTAPSRFLKLDYRSAELDAPLPQNAMALVRFGGEQRAAPPGVLTIDVDLAFLAPALEELWCSDEPVTTGHDGLVRFATDSELVFGVIEVNEAEFRDIRHATAEVYAAIQSFQNAAGFTSLLRMWNFLDAVNQGEGDLERYRQFCVGRAEGLGASITGSYPAATAIGRQRPTGVLQVFWIGAKQPGIALENPRQVSAYRYPRAHGPVSPSFSRATLAADGTLLISGTASIVGHASQHPDNTLAQLDETLLNLDALIEHARKQRGSVDQSALKLKVYIRDAAHFAVIRARLRQRFPREEMIFLAADICRRELLLEIECVMKAGSLSARSSLQAAPAV